MMVYRFISMFIVIIVLSGCRAQDREPIPQEVMFSVTSPSGGGIEAVIYTTQTDGYNFIGSGYRCFLAIRYPGSECILRRELTKGFGNYEGGVLGIKWISDHEILVERAIADQRKDIVYDTKSHEWRAYTDTSSQIPENTPIGDPDCPWDTAIALRSIGKDVTAPKLLERVEPETPEGLRMRYAFYMYDVVITVEGDVCGIKLLKSPDDQYPEYEKAVADAMLQWTFEPGLKDGQPVDCIMTLTVHPHLR